MIRVPIQIDFKKESPYKILFNNEIIMEHSQKSIGFETTFLEPRRLHTLTIEGDVEIIKLFIDGIDTKHFIYNGFVNDGFRGNTTKGHVSYYFQVPVWRWYIEWVQHDSSYFRKLSKNHQGFLPL